jgi:hypothetical protein
MPTPQPPGRAALGRARLAERARRVAKIRRRVVAATLASFALAWSLIVFDGPMGATTIASTRSSSSAPASTTPSSGATPSSAGTTSSDGTTSSGAPSGSAGPPAAVTTTQS